MTDVDRDLPVDVLVIGAGIPALYLARALHQRYSVCVVSEPGVPYESYSSAGRFGAGYAGNDVARMQPARRAAAGWGRWAEAERVPRAPGAPVVVVRPDDEAARTQLWADAGLSSRRLGERQRPAAMADGSSARHPAFLAGDDVVMDPAVVAARLRAGLEDRIVAAEVNRFGLITEQAVDHVELNLADGSVVPVTARYVVLASDVANAGLLQKVATGFKDRARRRAAVEAARSSQAVRRRPTIALRGGLPPLTAHVDGIDITALPVDPARPDGELVWLVQLPVDDGLTVVGPEDLRFDPSLDDKVVAEGLDRLFELCPGVRRRAGSLRWTAWVARKTEHPVVAGGGPAAAARPAPARIETLGMDGLVAAWPSHLSYSMIVGDVVVEKVDQALRAPAPVPADGPTPADLPRPGAVTTQNRWLRPDADWREWSTFAADLAYRHR
jgi:hypothetical protein